MFIHASNGAEHGMNKILLRTVDTDVVVIGISMAQTIGCDCLWFVFGTGTTFRYIDTTAMASSMPTTESVMHVLPIIERLIN